MNKYFPSHWLHAFWLLLLCGMGYVGVGVQVTWFPGSGFGVAQAQATGNEPTLAIPDNLSVTTGAAIAVPVTFAATHTGVVATIFSLDFDQRCLAFDAIDGNRDGLPDAITFAGLPAHSPSVSYNQTDTDGELDFVIADYQTPLDPLPAAAPLVTVTLRASCLPPPGQAVQAAILFSTTPRVSFSDAQGRDVSGSAQGGVVTIFAELPPPTTTPTPTPMATATATATTTETTSAPTASPSATATPTVNVSVTPPTPTATPTATLIPTAPPTPDSTNRAPEPANDQLTTDEDQAITFRPLANDTDADGDTITLVALEQAHLGVLTFVNQETVSYAPAKDLFGTDSFLYFVRDQRGKEATALITVLIRPVNDAPTIGPIGDQRHQVGDLVLLPVAIGDIDTPLSALTYTVSALPPQLSFNSSTQQIMGEVISSATGVYSSSITVSDGALSSTVRFAWTILGAGQTAHRYFLPLIVKGSEPSGHWAKPARPLRD